MSYKYMTREGRKKEVLFCLYDLEDDDTLVAMFEDYDSLSRFLGRPKKSIASTICLMRKGSHGTRIHDNSRKKYYRLHIVEEDKAD